jgi:DNA polymerase III alpha subunit
MFPRGLPPAYRAQIDHELRLIGQLGYAPYFLTVNSIVAESRRRGILCQGAAARQQLRLLSAGHHLDRSHPA